MDRNIENVIEKILAEIPEIPEILKNEDSDDDIINFRRDIERFYHKNIFYTATECKWDLLHDIIMSYFCLKDNDWYIKILSIFSTKDVEIIKKEIKGE